MNVVSHRIRSLLRRGRVDAEMARELDLHLEQLTTQYVQSGLSPADARAAARRDFGSVESTKDQCRDARRVTFVDDLLKDIAYAIRLLKRSPGFTLMAIGSLALGIGANTAIFSIVNAILLKPLPYHRPERLVAVAERNVLADEPNVGVAPGNFLNWQQSTETFDSMSAFTTRGMTLSAGTPGFEPLRIAACACSGNIFTTLGVSPFIGRNFRGDEDRPDSLRVVIISDDLWRRQFGSSAGLVGASIRLDGQDYQVIGVMPHAFAYPNRRIDAWVPIGSFLPRAIWNRHDLHFLQIIGRLKPGVPVERAAADVDRISAAYKSAHPGESTGKGANAWPLHDALVIDVRTSLMVLLGAVGCVLLIACVNLANLQLTRSVARGREIGIRIALGAGRGRIVRQLLTESLLLALSGGTVGVAIAVWSARLLASVTPRADVFLPSGTVPIDGSVFGFALGAAIVTGLVVGLVPAFRGSRTAITTELGDGTRSATGGRVQNRFRPWLVTAEVTLSFVLLVSAGLLIHSLSRLYDVRPGIRLDHMLTMDVALPSASYPGAAKRSALFSELGERLREAPGISSVGLSSCTPLSGSCDMLFFYIEGRSFVPGQFLIAHDISVDPHYFTAAGIPLLSGRTFRTEDEVVIDPQHPRTGKIVISQAMANTFFPGEDPLGKRIFFDYELQTERNQGIPAPRYEIIGVVGDVVQSLETGIKPTLYRPLLDGSIQSASILVHTSIEPQSTLSSIRYELRKIDPGLAISQVRTMDDLVGRSTSDRRFTMFLFIAFAALAVLLASVGLYGVVSYGVSQRTAEIGLRMALGATAGDVSGMVLMQGLKPALVGVGLGLISAMLASRLMTSLLFGVSPADPLTFLVAPPALVAVAALACYIPTLRAARLNPTIALRGQ